MMGRGHPTSIAPIVRRKTNTVVGRESELARIAAFLDRIPAGANVLVVEGEPGIGKTSLWLAGVGGAGDRSWRVLATRPTQAEASLAFSALGDLLDETGDALIADLPAPQRRALGIALLREEPAGPPPDHRAVAVAFLNTMRALAARGPVLLAVDDVQWLDPASAVVLEYAIRRLRDEPIGALLARRVEHPEALALGLDRLPEGNRLERLAVGPLSLGTLHQLLDAGLGLTLPRPTLRRIHSTSGGNPFFALELGRALQRQHGRIDPGEDLPVPDELRTLLSDRLAALPIQTRQALAVTAALAHPTIDLVGLVIEDDAATWLEPAIGSHVVDLEDGRIRFSHPLLASTAFSMLRPSRRREVHARVAAHLVDPEERARHLALAAEGPDEVVAIALEQAAIHAHGRGAPDVAADLAAQAVQVTPPNDVEAARKRTLAEAEYTMTAGDLARARALLERVLATAPSGPIRGDVLNRLGRVQSWGLDWRISADLHRQALAEAGGDIAVRAHAELGLTLAHDLLGDDIREAVFHASAAVHLAELLVDETLLGVTLSIQAKNELRLHGRMPTELVERALALEPATTGLAVTMQPSDWVTVMISWTDDLAAALAGYTDLVRRASEQGDEMSIIWILARMVPIECLTGAWGEARHHADEAYELALEAGQATNQAVILAGSALLEAHRGNTEAARAMGTEALQRAETTGALMARRMASWALGLLELALGHPSEAHGYLDTLVEETRASFVGEPGEMRHLPDEIEALIGMGHLEEAEALLEFYEERARYSERVSALAASARCHGLLHLAKGNPDAAFAAFDDARARYETITQPLDLGRTLFAIGSARRRAKQKLAARESLQASLAVFERLGSRLWEDKAHAELASIGGRVALPADLTPAEERVAGLVAEGKTNREVAAALFLTDRTVESHLSRIYAKLGLRSRSELARRLANPRQIES